MGLRKSPKKDIDNIDEKKVKMPLAKQLPLLFAIYLL
jgi:hypothetical protein